MTQPQIDPRQIALCIQQPWAELILRGVKTIEIRHSLTRHRGNILIYASKKPSRLAAVGSAVQQHGLNLSQLPSGLVVGEVELIDARPSQPDDASAACLTANEIADSCSWTLRNAVRFSAPVAASFVPYGIWFYPFQRKATNVRKNKISKSVL